MKDVSINILIHERADFLPMSLWSLSQIRQKDRVKVKLLISHNGRSKQDNATLDYATSIGRKMMDHGLDVHARAFTRLPPYNFMDKMRWMVNEPEPFIIRVDDDCFAGPRTWDALIGSTTLLKDYPNLLAVAPCVTNGIPTFEWWVETFCSSEQKEELYQMCLDNPCTNRWGKEFVELHKAYKEEKWNPDFYYNLCFKTGDERLGIHPMRFNLSIQKRINEIVLDDFLRFTLAPCLDWEYCFPQSRPYFCNTCFLIKKNDYREIVQNKVLARDSFEELTFNNYRRAHGKEIMFYKDAWMLNMYYRAVGNLKIEYELYRKIYEKLEW